MKEFLSKFTFGFLMAQLFPGAVAVLAITCPMMECCGQQSHSQLLALSTDAVHLWFESLAATVIFLFLAAATGMLIHGIDWAVLGFLENTGRKQDPETQEFTEKAKPIRLTSFHGRPIWHQLLLAPARMLADLCGSLAASNLTVLRIDENVPHFRAEDMALYAYLQDFYLYFAQFYAHMAYALFLSAPAVMLSCLLVCDWLTLLWAAPLLYLTISLFFIIGRVQLLTLFNAEWEIRSRNQGNQYSSRT